MSVTVTINRKEQKLPTFASQVQSSSSPKVSIDRMHHHTTHSKRPRKINLDMVLAATGLTRSSTESSEAYLKRVTHLNLQSKRIHRIEGLEQCENLKVFVFGLLAHLEMNLISMLAGFVYV